MLLADNYDIRLTLDLNTHVDAAVGIFCPSVYNATKPKIAPQHVGKFSTLITICGLVDIVVEQHSHRPFPATYNRGKRRIDYIVVSLSL